MRSHLSCRVDRCTWKATAYHTLVARGCLAPQTLAPRERAAARRIEFPVLDTEPPGHAVPEPQTLREVLDKLSDLAMPATGRSQPFVHDHPS